MNNTAARIIAGIKSRTVITSTEPAASLMTSPTCKRLGVDDGVSTWEVTMPDFGAGATKVIATVKHYRFDIALERAGVVQAIAAAI